MMTAKDLIERASDGFRHELKRGELVTMTPAGAKHGRISLKISHIISSYVEKEKLGYAFSAETGYRLFKEPDTVRAPDVSFLSFNSFNPDNIPDTYWDIAPELAIEVVSPNDRYGDLMIKVEEYLEAGTRMVWIVHPSNKTVSVFKSIKEIKILKEEDIITGEEVMPGFSCEVGKFFD